MAVARCTEAYKGVIHTRLLYQTQDYLLVFDDLRSDASHRYDWFYHDRGQVVESSVGGEAVTSDATDFPGMEYVENARQGDYGRGSPSGLRVRQGNQHLDL